MMPQYMHPGGKPKGGILVNARAHAVDAQGHEVYAEHVDAASSSTQGQNKGKKNKKGKQAESSAGAFETGLDSQTFHTNSASAEDQCSFCGRNGHAATECRTKAAFSFKAKEEASSWQQHARGSGRGRARGGATRGRGSYGRGSFAAAAGVASGETQRAQEVVNNTDQQQQYYSQSIAASQVGN